MIKYQASIIQQYAQRLYNQATAMIVGYTVLGALPGLAVYLLLDALDSLNETQVLAVTLGGVLLGFWTGRGRSFALRLRAQLALCQVQIEEHTRQSAIMLTSAYGHLSDSQDAAASQQPPQPAQPAVTPQRTW